MLEIHFWDIAPILVTLVVLIIIFFVIWYYNLLPIKK